MGLVYYSNRHTLTDTNWAETGAAIADISATPTVRGAIAVKILTLSQLNCQRVFIALFQKLD